MDSEHISEFDSLLPIPLNFLDIPASSSATTHPGVENVSDLDVFNLPNVLPDLDVNRPITIPFAERPPIPPILFHFPTSSSPIDSTTRSNGQRSNNSEDDNSADDSSQPSTSTERTTVVPPDNDNSDRMQLKYEPPLPPLPPETLTASSLEAAAAAEAAVALLKSNHDDYNNLSPPNISQLLQSPTLLNTPAKNAMKKPMTKVKSANNPRASITKSAKTKNAAGRKIKRDNENVVSIKTEEEEEEEEEIEENDSAETAITPRGNISHTRRCRAKVNKYFDRLMEVLPEPPEGVEVRHKAQMLMYAIDKFHSVRQRNMQLEMQLALSSPRQMKRWVQSVVTSSKGDLNVALRPFMALICLTKQWKYAELWSPSTCSATNSAQSLTYVTSAVPPTVQGEELIRVRNYRSNSRRFVFRPRSGVPGRVFLTMRPEWLPLLNDPIAFPRAPHAVQNKIEVTFAVPIIINGSVKMVVQFYDLVRRDYDPSTLNVANEIAELFGKAFTGMST